MSTDFFNDIEVRKSIRDLKVSASTGDVQKTIAAVLAMDTEKRAVVVDTVERDTVIALRQLAEQVQNDPSSALSYSLLKQMRHDDTPQAQTLRAAFASALSSVDELHAMAEVVFFLAAQKGEALDPVLQRFAKTIGEMDDAEFNRIDAFFIGMVEAATIPRANPFRKSGPAL